MKLTREELFVLSLGVLGDGSAVLDGSADAKGISLLLVAKLVFGGT